MRATVRDNRHYTISDPSSATNCEIAAFLKSTEDRVLVEASTRTRWCGSTLGSGCTPSSRRRGERGTSGSTSTTNRRRMSCPRRWRPCCRSTRRSSTAAGLGSCRRRRTRCTGGESTAGASSSASRLGPRPTENRQSSGLSSDRSEIHQRPAGPLEPFETARAHPCAHVPDPRGREVRFSPRLPTRPRSCFFLSLNQYSHWERRIRFLPHVPTRPGRPGASLGRPLFLLGRQGPVFTPRSHSLVEAFRGARGDDLSTVNTVDAKSDFYPGFPVGRPAEWAVLACPVRAA